MYMLHLDINICYQVGCHHFLNKIITNNNKIGLIFKKINYTKSINKIMLNIYLKY